MTSSDTSPSGPSREFAKDPATGHAGDPSMEDILASIRRILSEDEPAPRIQPAERAGMPGDVPEEVLVLDATMMVPDSPPEHDAAGWQPAQTGPKVAANSPAAVPQNSQTAEQQPLANPQPPAPDEAVLHGEADSETLLSGLVSPVTAAAAAASVSTLVRSLGAERSMQVYSGGPTIEDIVRAELRPQLKQWLDENLPSMVERLVRAELERVIGRAIP